MTLPLSNIAALHAQQLEVEAPWVWLYELQTTEDPPRRYRLTNNTQAVDFGENAAGDALRYYPAPIVHSEVEEQTDGSLPTITITVGNAGALTGSVLDASLGFVGQPVRIQLVSSLDLANPVPAIRQEGEVVSATVKSDAISFEVSAFNLYQLQFPPFVYSRRRCRWVFGSGECGYDLDASGAAFTTCGKTLENCKERGADELARGLPQLHPARFGGFPGIPRVIS